MLQRNSSVCKRKTTVAEKYFRFLNQRIQRAVTCQFWHINFSEREESVGSNSRSVVYSLNYVLKHFQLSPSVVVIFVDTNICCLFNEHCCVSEWNIRFKRRRRTKIKTLMFYYTPFLHIHKIINTFFNNGLGPSVFVGLLIFTIIYIDNKNKILQITNLETWKVKNKSVCKFWNKQLKKKLFRLEKLRT